MVPSYIISDAPDKGRGLFAMRDIRIGELIIAEAPLFTASSPMGIMRAVNRLSAVDRARLDDLSDVYSPSAPKPMTIFKTDAMPLGSGSLEGGLFPIISRINHSCDPNVPPFMER
jgi:hypothetical protein